MAAITKKRIIDYGLNILTRFNYTDDSRLDPEWWSMAIDLARQEAIIADYQENGLVRQEWLTELGLQTFQEVNFTDDPNVSFCNCNIAKCTVPNVVSFTQDGQADIGFYSVMSACGKHEYFPYPLNLWRIIPSENIRSKFHYYWRINTVMYINKPKTEKLRMLAVLAYPEDGYIINSTAQTIIAAGTVYIVKFGYVIYNGTKYEENTTFTGIGGVTTFSGAGTVYLQSQLVNISKTMAYPVSGDMARKIVLDILVKEFGIEERQIVDVTNNSVDDQQRLRAATNT